MLVAVARVLDRLALHPLESLGFALPRGAPSEHAGVQISTLAQPCRVISA